MLSADALERCYAKAFVANVAELAAETMRKWQAEPVTSPPGYDRRTAKSLVSFAIEAAKSCGIEVPSSILIAEMHTPETDFEIELIADMLFDWAEALEAWAEGDRDHA
ncbi:MAG: hypothetical protein U0836_09225 [Pirellulales bacterium]